MICGVVPRRGPGAAVDITSAPSTDSQFLFNQWTKRVVTLKKLGVAVDMVSELGPDLTNPTRPLQADCRCIADVPTLNMHINGVTNAEHLQMQFNYSSHCAWYNLTTNNKL